MGGVRVTARNLAVVRVEPDKHLVFLRGAVPGRGMASSSCDPLAPRRSSGSRESRRAPCHLATAFHRQRDVGELTLSDRVFGERPNDHLLWEAVRQARAEERQDSQGQDACRGLRIGRKLWRQKGTGRARIGSIRQPDLAAWWDRARASAARLLLPDARKAWAGALRSALSQKVRDGKLVVLAEFPLSAAVPGRWRKAARLLGVKGSCLVVTGERRSRLDLAVRNHPELSSTPATNIKVHDVLSHDTIILTQMPPGSWRRPTALER